MKNKKIKTRFAAKKLCAAAIALLLIISQTACAENQKNNANIGVSKTGFYLDTICTITIFGVQDPEESLSALSQEEQEKKILQIITEAFQLCDSYEKRLSKTIEDSDIARINAAGGKPVQVNTETAELIQKGIFYGEKSEGAFDITIGKATELWGFREAEAGEETESGMSGQVPDAKKLAETMRHVDWSKVKLDGSCVQLEDPEMELDLGGIAKGYIADKVTAFLEAAGVSSGIIDLGGNIVAIGGKTESLIGAKEAQTDFTIGIKDPKSESGGLIGTLPASDKTVVTSGTYERYFVEDGKKYHHILDSKSGMPTDTDVLSVTIISEKGHSADCDALSTSCLALGVKKGMKLIRSIKDTEAIFVDTDGKLHETSENTGFKQG